MKIYVCVKHVPDTAATIRVKADGNIDENITFIMNPYDENAVEEAARLKKQTNDAEVIAISLGKESAEATLRSAMAMGADRGILIKSAANHDSLATARVLGSAIQMDGAPDVIFTGREAIDSEGFQTMFHLGAFLGLREINFGGKAFYRRHCIIIFDTRIENNKRAERLAVMGRAGCDEFV